MANYHHCTNIQLIEEICERFRGIEKLSNNGKVCLYSHEINGIGCAVGCLLPNEIAVDWNRYGSIHSICYTYAAKETRYKNFFTAAQIETLRHAQLAHDRSRSVAEFLDRLELIKARLEREAGGKIQ